MKDIHITIRGKTPLLMNRFTDSAQMQATAGSRSSISNDSTPAIETARSKLYMADDGTIGIPQPNMFRCIIDAGKFHKVGKSKVTTMKSSVLPSCIDIEPIFIPVEHSQPWKVDSRPVRIPSTGGRIVAHRPCFDDWKLSFSITLDEEVMSERLLRDVVDDAGSKIGLGDYRPDCKGPFGKFVVEAWTVLQEA